MRHLTIRVTGTLEHTDRIIASILALNHLNGLEIVGPGAHGIVSRLLRHTDRFRCPATLQLDLSDASASAADLSRLMHCKALVSLTLGFSRRWWTDELSHQIDPGARPACVRVPVGGRW